jgi:hypothetical protein
MIESTRNRHTADPDDRPGLLPISDFSPADESPWRPFGHSIASRISVSADSQPPARV